MQPILSIIIPVFQAEEYLKPCVDSVLKQTFTDFELILVNDGSTDKSPDICEKYARMDRRVKVIHQANKGQAAARNKGIDNSSGECIGFMDNDDIILPNMFEILVKNIKTVRADISSCSFTQQNEKGEKQHDVHDYKRYTFSNIEGMRQLLSRTKLDIYVWTKIYDREFINQHQIRFEEGKNDEDMLFNYMAFTFSKKCIFEDNPLYIYNHRDNSASRVFPQKDLEKYLKGTLYRVNKIETETKQNYPTLYYLAIRQKIIYCIQMLAKIMNSSLKGDNLYYQEVMDFLKSHKIEVFRNKKQIGLKYIGILLLLFLPNNLYMHYKRLKNRLTL